MVRVSISGRHRPLPHLLPCPDLVFLSLPGLHLPPLDTLPALITQESSDFSFTAEPSWEPQSSL